MSLLKIRHLCRIPPVENFNDLRGDVPIVRPKVEGIRHQCSGLYRVAKDAYSWNPIFLCQSTQQDAIGIIFSCPGDPDSVDMISLHCVESSPVLGLANGSLQ